MFIFYCLFSFTTRCLYVFRFMHTWIYVSLYKIYTDIHAYITFSRGLLFIRFFIPRIYFLWMHDFLFKIIIESYLHGLRESFWTHNSTSL